MTTDFSAQHSELWERLPTLLEYCAQQWSLRVLPAFPNLSFNYVAPAQREDGTDVVLKIGLPHRELRTEIDALRLYAGRNSVRLLEADPEKGILLLERIRIRTTINAPLLHLE